MSAEGAETAPGQLVGGRLLAEVTNRIVAFMREHYGRGPIKAKTYVLDNLIVCGLSNGFTAIERMSQAHVEPDLTIEMFLMDGPVPGFGALELVDPPDSGSDGKTSGR